MKRSIFNSLTVLIAMLCSSFSGTVPADIAKQARAGAQSSGDEGGPPGNAAAASDHHSQK